MSQAKGFVDGAGREASLVKLGEKKRRTVPVSAAGNVKPTAERYYQVRVMTSILDYTFLAVTFHLYGQWCGGDKFCPTAVAMISVINFTGLVLLDVAKAVIFADVLAATKIDHLKSLAREFLGLFGTSGIERVSSFLFALCMGEGIIYEFKDKSAHRSSVLYHIFYWVKNAYFLAPLSFYTVARFGALKMDPLMGSGLIVGQGGKWEILIPNVVVVFSEFFLMSLLKDILCMNYLHEMMHRLWYDLHKVHHLPMGELSCINVAYFDITDLVLENLIAPALLLGAKSVLCSGWSTPQVDFHSMLLLVNMETNIHSVCPYTVSCYNPILDYIFNPVISHNLHHVLNKGHYTVWPWHQIKGLIKSDGTKTNSCFDASVGSDAATYNKVFKTRFPVRVSDGI